MKRRDIILQAALKIPKAIRNSSSNVQLRRNTVADAGDNSAMASPPPVDYQEYVIETNDGVINSHFETDRNITLAENHEREENSSPLRSMSPETRKIYDMLQETDNFDDKDEVVTTINDEIREHILPGCSTSDNIYNSNLPIADEPPSSFNNNATFPVERSQDTTLLCSHTMDQNILRNKDNLSDNGVSHDEHIGDPNYNPKHNYLEESTLTPDTPTYSPLTPLCRNNNATLPVEKSQDTTPLSSPTILAGPSSVDFCYKDPTTPNTPLFSPITPAYQKATSSSASIDQNNLGNKDNLSDDDFSNDDDIADPNYNPKNDHLEESTSCESEILDSVQPSNELDINQPSTSNNSFHGTFENHNAENTRGRPKKGRKRKFEAYTLSERKMRKYKNLPYHGNSKEVLPKSYKEFNCSCQKKCFLLISNEKRKAEFSKFYNLGSYEAQLMYIVSNVKETLKKRSYTCTNSKSGKRKPRNYCRSYTLCEVAVCKDMFSKTLQITNQKLTVSLEKNRLGGNINDQRGKQRGGWNKTPQEDIDFICDIINKIPKYESHYARENNNDRQYLQPGMTHIKLYNLYLDEFKKVYGESRQNVSFNTFKNIFLTKFNLTCKALKKDTCNICDRLANQIKCCTSDETKTSLLLEKENHWKTAENLRKFMNNDMNRAKNDDTFECITYDLEKTLPLPRIPTNIVFYKRQLWLYNCGIHVCSTDTGHCFVWVEGEAGRGAQEVGSCLAFYIKNKLSQKVRHLVLWSDSCGGQNRNIKITLLLKAILENHPTLQTITFKYLQPGHTFLPNDTDFSKIETSLKLQSRLYTADDYINVIKSCRNKNPLIVKKMETQDFVGTQKLEKNIVNRKVSVDKKKVNWLKIKEILIKKEKLYSIFTKTAEENFQEINIEKKLKGNTLPISEELLILLYPNGKEIAQAKLDDLKSLYHLIPDDCLAFYKSLKGNHNILDDIDGYGSAPDFQIETLEDF